MTIINGEGVELSRYHNALGRRHQCVRKLWTVLGARTAVFKNVEPWIVVDGNPAKYLKMRKLNITNKGRVTLDSLPYGLWTVDAMLHNEWRIAG